MRSKFSRATLTAPTGSTGASACRRSAASGSWRPIPGPRWPGRC